MDGPPMITFTLWLDPQWELALADLIPQIERGIADGLIAVAEIDYSGVTVDGADLKLIEVSARCWAQI